MVREEIENEKKRKKEERKIKNKTNRIQKDGGR